MHQILLAYPIIFQTDTVKTEPNYLTRTSGPVEVLSGKRLGPIARKIGQSLAGGTKDWARG